MRQGHTSHPQTVQGRQCMQPMLNAPCRACLAAAPPPPAAARATHPVAALHKDAGCQHTMYTVQVQEGFQVVIGLDNGAVVFISPRNNNDNRRQPKELQKDLRGLLHTAPGPPPAFPTATGARQVIKQTLSTSPPGSLIQPGCASVCVPRSLSTQITDTMSILPGCCSGNAHNLAT
jgi:hypothetical protein